MLESARVMRVSLYFGGPLGCHSLEPDARSLGEQGPGAARNASPKAGKGTQLAMRRDGKDAVEATANDIDIDIG